MSKLGEAHIEHAKVLRAEGKSMREIVETLQKTYGIKTYAGAVAKACRGVMKARPGKGAKLAHHIRHLPEIDEASLDRLTKDIIALLKEIPRGYRKVFLHLRKELIKSRSEVYEMLEGAGIDVPESAIK